MLIIRHRINTVEALKTVPEAMGIELDLRDRENRLILQHDPFSPGEDFETLLKHYRQALMILNIKSEGIEDETLRLIRKYGVKDYFFLDLSFPSLIRLAGKGESKIAVRYSEHEPPEACLALAGKVEWVWMDCFTRLPLTREAYGLLKKHFKICAVSPELQKHDLSRIREFRELLAPYPIDAVCTKYPEHWA